MKLKLIVKSFQPYDIQVVNAETGESVKGVTMVDLHVDMNSCPRMTVEVLDFEAVVEGEAEIKKVAPWLAVEDDNSVEVLRHHAGQVAERHRLKK